MLPIVRGGAILYHGMESIRRYQWGFGSGVFSGILKIEIVTLKFALAGVFEAFIQFAGPRAGIGNCQSR
jgi:hypothetical protein